LVSRSRTLAYVLDSLVRVPRRAHPDPLPGSRLSRHKDRFRDVRVPAHAPHPKVQYAEAPSHPSRPLAEQGSACLSAQQFHALKAFLPSVQSAFQLSLTLLVSYRACTQCLALPVASLALQVSNPINPTLGIGTMIEQCATGPSPRIAQPSSCFCTALQVFPIRKPQFLGFRDLHPPGFGFGLLPVRSPLVGE